MLNEARAKYADRCVARVENGAIGLLVSEMTTAIRFRFYAPPILMV